jgi:hypothetical protein
MTSVAAGEGPARFPRVLATWLAPVLAAAVLLAIYLAPFLRDPGRPPPGLDTPGYVWRAGTVYELGLEALPSFRDRPGHPIVVSVLRDVTGATPLDLARIWPAVIAAAIGLAAIALAGVGMRERPFVGIALAVGLAGSTFIAVTAVGYAANLLVDLFLVAALALALRGLDGGTGLVAVAVLVVAAAVTHWLLAVLLVGLLAFVAAAALVWPANPHADEDPRRAGRRLLVAVAVAALLGGIALLLAPALPSEIVHQTFHEDVDRRIEKRLPPLGLPLTLPVAACGAIAIAALGGPARRRVLPTLLAWAAIAPAGLAAWYWLDLKLPPYRTVAVALGVPALIVLGASVPASALLERGRRLLAVAAALLLLAATGWLAGTGAETWWRAEPAVEPADLAQAATLDAYLRTLAPDTSAIVPVPQGASGPPRILRLGMAARRAGAVVLLPADLSDGTDAFVDDVLRRYPGATVVVFLDAYRRSEPGAGVELGPGVTLVHGPRPAEQLPVPSIRTDAPELLRVAAIALALLVVTGLGWTLALTRLPLAGALGLAAAIGAATLVILGLVTGRLGLSYAYGGGVAVAAATAASGWVAWLVRRWLATPAAAVSDAP